MTDVKALLEEMKASPYEMVEVRAPHTGVVEYVVTETATQVSGVSGTWDEKPGTLLAYLERENTKKPIHAPLKGEVDAVCLEHSGQFVEEGTLLCTLRHYLTKEEVIAAILKKTLHLFHAPEQAKYYFTPDVDTKVKASGCKSVRVREGMDLFIMSRMKREAPLPYSGPEGLIYALYFKHNESVPAGAPLIGVCPEDLLPVIQDVVNRVQGEWEEHN
ncbi:biotin attachment protein [Desulfobaculum sp. SPO524]|uniref:biotin attachment protein n=1 Tax=Desulfobaculum sp. SPO524 TaxID=3378071 RepID=UPI003853CE08